MNEVEVDVFVVEQFFNSLTRQGKFPMYTCSCGIFGCGGFYVEVRYNKEGTVSWITEQSSGKKFVFSRENIQSFAEQLIGKLDGLNVLLQENGLQPFEKMDIYREIVETFSRTD